MTPLANKFKIIKVKERTNLKLQQFKKGKSKGMAFALNLAREGSVTGYAV